MWSLATAALGKNIPGFCWVCISREATEDQRAYAVAHNCSAHQCCIWDWSPVCITPASGLSLPTTERLSLLAYHLLSWSHPLTLYSATPSARGEAISSLLTPSGSELQPHPSPCLPRPAGFGGGLPLTIPPHSTVASALDATLNYQFGNSGSHRLVLA